MLAGCSSPPPEYQPPPGALIAGTAHVTINGQDAGTTDSVQCDSAGPLMMMRTGDPNGPGLPAWRSVGQAPDDVMEFGDGGGAMAARPHPDAVDFWMAHDGPIP